MKTIYILSLGCAKNLVESEMLSGLLSDAHWRVVADPAEADVLFINTCGFIQAAKEEAIAAILDLARYKAEGRCQLLVAGGCMAEKYAQEMAAAMPEIDAILPGSRNQEIVPFLESHLPQTKMADWQPPADPYLLRRLSTPPYMAYLKIADGCNNCCSYCLIPQLRGPLRSRPIEALLEEANMLLARGVRELIVIAQDITAYGMDLYGQPSLTRLLRELVKLPFHWIRLLYAYPNRLDEDLVRLMAESPNVCHYLDLPLQHIDDTILAAMNRQGGAALIREKISLLKRYMPDIALRTTVMVGFPGEDKRAFANLLDFLAEGHFDWVGAFAYCREADTPAYAMKGQKDAATKERRLAKAMTLLMEQSVQNQRRYIGREMEILVEGLPEEPNGYYTGRSQYQAPEVDGLTYFKTKRAKPQLGEIVRVRILSADIYDLIGEMIEEC